MQSAFKRRSSACEFIGSRLLAVIACSHCLLSPSESSWWTQGLTAERVPAGTLAAQSSAYWPWLPSASCKQPQSSRPRHSETQFCEVFDWMMHLMPSANETLCETPSKHPFLITCSLYSLLSCAAICHAHARGCLGTDMSIKAGQGCIHRSVRFGMCSVCSMSTAW